MTSITPFNADWHVEREPAGPKAGGTRTRGAGRRLRVALIGIVLALTPTGVMVAHDCESAIQAATEEAQAWPNYDPTRAIDEARAFEAATVEGQSRPDYDPTRVREEAAIQAATEEAAGWPNYDPTRAIDQANAVEAATIEGQSWPDYDPTGTQADVETASGYYPEGQPGQGPY